MDEHLFEIDLLDHEAERSGNWQEFSYSNIQQERELALRIDDKWIPKSCLRLDGACDLWIACWFYAKEF